GFQREEGFAPGYRGRCSRVLFFRPVTEYDVGFVFSSRRRHTRLQGDWSSDVCSSDLSAGRDKSASLSFFKTRGDYIMRILGPDGKPIESGPPVEPGVRRFVLQAKETAAAGEPHSALDRKSVV